MRLWILAAALVLTTAVSETGFAASDGDEVAATYFVRLRQFATRCESKDAVDRAWCDAYIAGVVDTIASNRSLKDDQARARCLRGMVVSLSQVREGVMKVVSMMEEDKSSPLLNAAAMNSVVAGVLVHVCK
jgi:hypothetical protein